MGTSETIPTPTHTRDGCLLVDPTPQETRLTASTVDRSDAYGLSALISDDCCPSWVGLQGEGWVRGKDAAGAI